jgi:hypothetical protein
MKQSQTNQALVLSGLTELAAGVLTGWPYALAISDPDRARALGIRSVPRLRSWTNAGAFGLLAFRPQAGECRAYRSAVAASFATVTRAFTSLNFLAYRRRGLRR